MAKICDEPNVVLLEQFIKAPKVEVKNFLEWKVITIDEIPIDQEVTADEEFVAEGDTAPEGMYT